MPIMFYDSPVIARKGAMAQGYSGLYWAVLPGRLVYLLVIRYPVLFLVWNNRCG